MKYQISDLIDLPALQELMDSFYEATGIVHALIDNDSRVLTASGWEPVCTEFHRKNPRTCQRCEASDRYILDHLRDGPYVGYPCPNGLNDYAVPVIIGGEHLANIFTGQIFHAPPDLDFFRAQAAEFSFDQEPYLEAVRRVRVIPRERMPQIMAFLVKLAQMLAQQGITRLRQIEAERELRERNRQQAVELAQRQEAEAALRQEKQFSDDIIGSLPGIFYLLDTEGRLVRWNQRLAEVTGYRPEELAGMAAVQFFPPDQVPILKERMAAVFAGAKSAREYRLLTKDGRQIAHYLTGQRTSIGERSYLVGVGIDLSELKAAEAALEATREAHRQHLEQQVAERTAALLAANRELQAFTYAASHDLKSPLARISSFSTLLERNYRERLEGDGLLFLDFIRSNATRMTRLIEDMLAHAQIEQQTTNLQSIVLRAAVRSVVNEKLSEYQECRAEIRMAVPDVEILADPLMFAQVLRNLLDNALKYSAQAENPVVEIGAEVRGGDCRLWVQDNGVGFDMAYHDRIFEIFRRLHTYAEFPGSGVGLALVRKAMERMNGRVWAESLPGRGATFFLEMPARPASH
ncbi:MAG TPA: PocR ligand-binding domain-containing protein [Rhodocyclaceae bacterium]|nr:PocR ligand-binding domain-containing protein [Rhodocyclaceae bacterium]